MRLQDGNHLVFYQLLVFRIPVNPSPAALASTLLTPHFYIYHILPLAIPHCYIRHWLPTPRPHIHIFLH